MRFRRTLGTPDGAAPESQGDAAPDADPAEELVRLRSERLSLIQLCLYARDRISSPAVAERIDARLGELGITTERPDGDAFDPAQHEAAATVATEDDTLHDTIAETEVPGYADRGVQVRPAVVSVYRKPTT